MIGISLAAVFALFFVAGWLAHPVHIYHGARMIKYLLEGIVIVTFFMVFLLALDVVLILLGQQAELFKAFLFALVGLKVLPEYFVQDASVKIVDLAGIHYLLLTAFLLFLSGIILILYHKRRNRITDYAQSQFITFIRGDLRLAGRIVKILDGVESKSQYEVENIYEFQNTAWKKIAASKSVIADEHIQKRYANEYEFRQNEPMEQNPTAVIQNIHVEVFIKDEHNITYLLNESFLKYIDSDTLVIGRTEVPTGTKGEKINLKINLYDAHTRTKKTIPILLEWPIPEIQADATRMTVPLRGAAWEKGITVDHETELHFWETKQQEYRELCMAHIAIPVKEEEGEIIYLIPTLQNSAELRVMIGPQAISRMLYSEEKGET